MLERGDSLYPNPDTDCLMAPDRPSDRPPHKPEKGGRPYRPDIGCGYRTAYRTDEPGSAPGRMSGSMSDYVMPHNRRLSGRISGHVQGGYLAAHVERSIGRCTEGRVIKADLSALTLKAGGLYFRVVVLLI